MVWSRVVVVRGFGPWLPPALLILGLAGSPSSAGAQDAQPSERSRLPEGVTQRRISDGRTIFLGEGMCWACHGEDAKGARGVGADLTDEDWWHSDGSYQAIVRQILSGVPVTQVRNELGAMMPPKGGSQITEAQVHAVAAYVWSLRELTQR